MVEWIVAVCSLVSLAGAGFSWWKANASRESRVKSEAAAQRAVDTLAEVRRQTVALEELAAAARPAPLVFERDAGVLWRLRNTTSKEIAIERVENLSAFPGKPIDQLPVVIQPGDAIQVTLLHILGADLPASMELRIRGRADVLRVPVPPA